MTTTPNFNFAGDCEQAIHFYETVFSTKADFILHYSDAKPEDWKRPLTEEQKKLVYHAEMRIAGQRFMFSDIIEFDVTKGNALFITVTFDTKEEVRRAYDLMVDGGSILVPLHSATYSSACASLVDRFGIRWGLMTETVQG
jgi:PhnB protein